MTNPKPPDAETVFLVSGGAKGITAQCVIALARRYKCKFILVGRSSFEAAEPAWAQSHADETSLKQQAMRVLQAQDERPTPRRVQTMVQSVLSQREIRHTMHEIQRVGAQAKYLSADITQLEALRAVVETAEQHVGTITGVIHGAGVLADKRIEHKSARDFDVVYGVKVGGLENLFQCVPPEHLEHLILFSSIAGVYGNVGQADYAMANEVLNKVAHWMKARHPSCQVRAIDWGPWDGGMVSPDLKALFAQRGIDVIPIEVGTQMFTEALAGDTNQNEDNPQVVISAPLPAFVRPLGDALKEQRVRRTLSLEANPFLEDHVIGGVAVLPTVCAISWIVNTCEQLYPGYTFFKAENYQALKGIVFDDTLAESYTLDLVETAKTQAGEITFKATIWSAAEEDVPRYHYRCRVTLCRELPPAPRYVDFDLADRLALLGSKLYEDNVLFHGPGLQGVRRVLNINSQKLTLACFLPAIPLARQGQFPVQTFNPYVADVQFQSLLIWVNHVHQAGSLPLKAQSGTQFRPLPFDELFYVSLDVRSSTELALVADLTAHDAEGDVYTQVSGAEVTVSKRLNALFQQNRLQD